MLKISWMVKYVWLTLLFFAVIPTYAQKKKDTADHRGTINIIKDPRLDFVIEKHIAINKEKGTIPGFRIQLAVSYKRDEIYKRKADFLVKYPDIHSYVIYQQPYFKLRVGDYKTRLDAYRALQKLLDDYPDAFIVKDKIKTGIE